MKAKRGYYSLIQFCPNPSRAESVNLGIALFCPDVGFLASQIAAGNNAAAKLVGWANIDPAALNAAKRAIERRLEVDRASFQTLEDFQHFAETRANVLRLTSPRPIKVIEPEQELKQLFQELVGGRPRRTKEEVLLSPLDDLFHRLEQQGRAKLNMTVTVPLAGRRLHVPYVYQNGTVNLVKPKLFSKQEGPAIGAAMQLAIEGDLLQKHCDEEGSRKLIVISSFEPSGNGQEMKGRIANILREYNVKSVAEDEVEVFAAQVEQEAH